jgi:hypothetical protein
MYWRAVAGGVSKLVDKFRPANFFLVDMLSSIVDSL